MTKKLERLLAQAQNNTGAEPKGASSRWFIVLVLFLAIGGFFLLSEHRAHAFYLLPLLLLLVCPVLHFWLHGRSESHDHEIHSPTERNRGER